MTKLIKDFELESWIRSSAMLDVTRPDDAPLDYKLTWQQRVQYAAGHALNDFFTMESYFRFNIPIQALLNRRWPRNKETFHGSLHYWEVYNRIVSSLTRLTSASLNETPILMFEQLQTRVAELDADLSMIFQAVWQRPGQSGGIKLQKFLVEDQPEMVRAFLHMANVFWNSAYGYPPEEVEILVLLSGKTYTYTQENLNLQESLDYVYLLSDTVELHKAEEDEAFYADKNKAPYLAYEAGRTGTGCS